VPSEFQNNLVTGDFRANRLVRFALSDDGSGFAAREREPLIRSTHIAFRPIDAKMGPDGALYIADWYNPIIQHGEVDFRDDRRDHLRGRIWRLAFRDGERVAAPKLHQATTPVLLDAMMSPEGYTREQARRLLRERGAAEVLPALGMGLPQAPTEHVRLEGLWLHQALDRPNEPLLRQLLASADPAIRAPATRVAGAWADRIPSALALLAERAEDENPRVRLEAIRALAVQPGKEAPALAMRALSKPLDTNLDYALWLTARETAGRWLPELAAGRNPFATDDQAVFALLAVNTPEIVGPLMERYRGGRISADYEARVLTALGQLGGPSELGRVFDLAMGDTLPAPRRAALLDALADAQRRRQVRPDCPLERLARILSDGEADPGLRASAARAAGAWKQEDLRPILADHLAANAGKDWEVRQAAIDALVELGGPASAKALAAIDGPGHDARARSAALAGLAAIDLPTAAGRAAALLASLEATADPAPLVAAFTGRKGGPEALAKALEGRSLPPDIARLASRAARSAGTDQAALVAALGKAGGLDASAGWSKLPPEQALALASEAIAQGDPARGEAIFRRDELTCLKCHAVAGSGSPVGPGLESIGASAPADYLVDSLLYPDKAIKEGYHSVVLALADGQVLSGREMGTDGDRLRLVTSDLREILVDPSEIEERKQGGSLMPAALLDELTRAELLDLVAFLASLGKPGPYAVGPERAIRTWRVVEPTEAAHHPIRRSGLESLSGSAEPAPFAPPIAGATQRAVYSQVDGSLPLADLPALKPYGDSPPLVVARAWLEVTTPGAVVLRPSDSRGLRVFVGADREVPAAEAMTVELDRGLHPLTFIVDRSQFPGDRLRVVVDDAPGSPAQARPLVGP
jgi:putative heme-binding domain-containing protein